MHKILMLTEVNNYIRSPYFLLLSFMYLCLQVCDLFMWIFKMPSCEVCKRRFTQARNVKRHVNEQHGDNKLFDCCEEKCKSTFKRRSHLTHHLQKKHSYTKVKARSSCITSQPKLRNIISNRFWSDISNHYSDVSTYDEVLDLVKELDDILYTYIPEDTPNSFIDDLLEATGSSIADLSLSKSPFRTTNSKRSIFPAKAKILLLQKSSPTFDTTKQP